jgi:hypothetical protein
MSALSIDISLKSVSLVASESFPVEVRVRNTGTTPVQVPDPDSPSAFEFAVRGLSPGLPSTTLSVRRARLARDPNPVAGLGEQRIALSPAATQAYREDLAGYMAEPLPPGRYAVSVLYRDREAVAQSSDASFVIDAPVVAAFAAAASPVTGGLDSVLAHGPANAPTVILQRESRPRRPQDGVAYRRLELAMGASATGVAVAIQTMPGPRRPGGSWYAWLQGRSLGAGMGERGRSEFVIDAVDLGLDRPSLEPVGWQPEPGRAHFVAIGSNSAGKPAVAVATFLARERRATVRTVALGGSSVPQHWAARYRADSGGTIDLVAAETAQDGTRVYHQSVTLDSGEIGAPVALIQRAEPVTALALGHILTAPATDAVDMLFGPAGSPPRMTFVRAPLGGGAPLVEYPFNLPLDDRKQPPTDWALAPAPRAPAVAVAKFRGQIIGTAFATGARGFLVDPKSPDAQRLQLHALGDTVWAVWLDPARGFQYRKLP